MRFCIGVDLGKMQDFTAIVVNEQVDTFKNRLFNEVGWHSNPNAVVKYYRTRHLERMKGVTYTAIEDRVENIMMNPTIWKECDLVMDVTGVGMGPFDECAKRGLEPIGIQITSGHQVSVAADGIYNVPKRELVMAGIRIMEQKRVQIVAPEWTDTLKQELRDFRVKLTITGHLRFEHRDGANDVLLLSWLMALWWQTKDEQYTDVALEQQEEWDPFTKNTIEKEINGRT